MWVSDFSIEDITLSNNDQISAYTGLGRNMNTERLAQPSNSYAFVLTIPSSFGREGIPRHALVLYGMGASNNVYTSMVNKNNDFSRSILGSLNFGKILTNTLLSEVIYGGVLYTEYIFTNFDMYGSLRTEYFIRRVNEYGSFFDIQSDDRVLTKDLNTYQNNYSIKNTISFMSYNELRIWSSLYVTQLIYISEIPSDTQVIFDVYYKRYTSDSILDINTIARFYPNDGIYKTKGRNIKKIYFDVNYAWFIMYGERYDDDTKNHFILVRLTKTDGIIGSSDLSLHSYVPYEVTKNAGRNMWISSDFKYIFFVNNSNTSHYEKGLSIIRGNNALINVSSNKGWDENVAYYENDNSTLDLRNVVQDKYVLDIVFNNKGDKMIILCNDTKGCFVSSSDFYKDYVEGIQPNSMYCFMLSKTKWVQIGLQTTGMSDLWNNYNNSGTSGMGYRPTLSFDYNNIDDTTGISFVYPAYNRNIKGYYAQLTFGD